jgi:hypothetical protein
MTSSDSLPSTASTAKGGPVTFETLIRSEYLRTLVSASPLGPYMDGFVASVAGIGYTPRSLYDLVLGATRFARCLVETGIADVAALRDRDVADFGAMLPVFRCRGYQMRSVHGSRAGHHVLQYLRSVGATPPEAVPVRVYDWVLEDWLAFLRRHCGLTPASLVVYRRYVEPLLQDLDADAAPNRLARALSADRLRMHVQGRAARLARSTRKNLVLTLRSFLRFAFSRGYVSRDLSDTLARVPCFTHDSLPRGPKWADLTKILRPWIDRRTKDDAILPSSFC